MHYPQAPPRSNYFSTLRLGDWKVIYHYHPGADSSGARYQLFHLKADPFEQQDLAESHPQELRRRMQELITRLKQHDAQYPLDKDNGQALAPSLPK